MTEVAVAVGRDRPAGGAGSAAVEVAGLLKRYDGRAAVDGLDLRVARGEIVALLGRNGAGKTTTVEIIEGYREPDAGTVRVLGLDPRRDGALIRPRLGVMLQRGELYGQIRVREAVELFAAFYDDPLDPGALLDQLSLGALADRRYRALSGGERARLDLALALIGRPDVAILDEPTAALDADGRRTAWRLLGELRDRGAAVLVTTHLIEEAERLADRVAIIEAGRLVAVGRPAELRDAGTRPRREVVLELAEPLSDAHLAALGRLGRAVGVRVMPPAAYAIATDSPAELLVELAAWLLAVGREPVAITLGRVSLEEVFLRLVREATA